MNQNCEHDRDHDRDRDRCELAEFIRRNYEGANITVFFVGGGSLTGEVVDGFDCVIGLKAGATTYYVNAFFISYFV